MRLSIPTVLVLTGAVLASGSLPRAAEPETACGDVNGDARINITDAVYLVSYLFLGGDAPVCSVAGVQDEAASCAGISRKAVEACKHEALAGYWKAGAMCDTLSSPAEVRSCRDAAKTDLTSALEECQAQVQRRQDACEVLGTSPYGAALDPEDFVERIDNPYLPLAPGLTLTYESRTAGGDRRKEVSVTSRTRKVLGIQCVVVKEVETLDGEIVEETEEWFAQDVAGNVWNFGEQSFGYDDSEIADWGQWQAGIDGARPGIVMRGRPEPGEVYHQGFAVGVSEDLARVLSLSASVSLAAAHLGPFENCLQLEESSVLEDEVEHKFFASGIGLVLEVDLESGERMKLVERRVTSVR